MFYAIIADQTSFFDALTSVEPLGGCFRHGFQHVPWGPADVNA